MKNPFKKQISRLLEEAGVDYEFSIGGKHPRVVIQTPKGKRTVALPSSPGCRRALLNSKMEVRHALRDGGVSV